MSDEQEGDSYGREKKTTGIFGYPQMDGGVVVKDIGKSGVYIGVPVKEL